MNRLSTRTLGAAGLLLVCCGGAFAHEGHAHPTFASGFLHPFHGLDHLLAMVAVGLLGARHAGHWRWRLPLGFVSGLALGGVLGAYHVGLPGVEMSIAVSVLLFGVLLSLGKSVSPWALAGIALFAGIPHGHAHLMEAGVGTTLGYGAGMVLGSALLHGGGLLAGLGIGKAGLLKDRWQWVAGPSIAAAGIALTVMVAIG